MPDLLVERVGFEPTVIEIVAADEIAIRSNAAITFADELCLFRSSLIQVFIPSRNDHTIGMICI